ncbi:MAG: glutathione metabolism protein [Alphaproteobacteria bacterium]|nr:glutathione metabolism protein [Alphaproteobacteria bacterium]
MAVTLYAALLTFWGIFLSVYVIQARHKFQKEKGSDYFEIKRRVRTQANFMEYTPLFLLLLFMLEYYAFSLYIVNILGLLYVVGRLFHAYSLLIFEKYDDKGNLTGGLKYRTFAMPLTFIPLGIAAFLLLFQFLMFVV